ncbi:MAG: hypothetical protein GY869_32545 [Planctomycetes bacterium]|nr:hypothetical protein [Planctomycetota bacterium]
MMGGKIYQTQPGGGLMPMEETPYENEDMFQKLLAKNPDLMAGEQVNRTDPRRWLLVKREASVPSEVDSAGRWSLDHLFLDQDGVPTLVEVKRSSDTRIRREVVGQMLDYAANAVVYWPLQDIQAMFEKQCEQDEVSPDERLAEFLGADKTDEDIWQKVKTNLQAGRIRMMFVADEIPSELRRIVEFLNVQMDPAEVLALEIKQYLGENNTCTLVPQLIGQTEEALRKKQPGKRMRDVPWDEDSFLEFIRQSKHPDDEAIAMKIIVWTKRNKLVVNGGRGAKAASLNFGYNLDDKIIKPISFYADGNNHISFYIHLEDLRQINIANSIIEELCQRLNRIAGAEIKTDRQYPTIKINLLCSQENQTILFKSLNWLMEQLIKD